MSNSSKVKERFTDQVFGVNLLAPAFAFLGCIAGYPIVRIVWLSFFKQNLDTNLQPQFCGFLNYVRLFHDGHFLQTLLTTGVFTVGAVTCELILGLWFALLLNQTFRGRSFARAVALVPWSLPTAVLALAWIWILNDQFGVLNNLLLKLGIISHRIVWLGTPKTALLSVIIADIWKTTPFMMIILLAGLQNISNDLYEAIQIDGAKQWRSFRLITLPLLTPSILLALLFRTIQSFGVFDLVYVMTGGGPGGATETVALYTYSTFLRYLDFGYGAAMVVITVLIIAALGLLIYWPYSRRSE